MKIIYITLLLSIMATSLSGCIIWRVQDTPNLKGHVLNSETHKPLQDVEVYLMSKPYSPAFTDTNGNFDIPPTYSWTVIQFLIPMDRFSNPQTVFEKNGFHPTILPASEYSKTPVLITPKKAQQDAAANP